MAATTGSGPGYRRLCRDERVQIEALWRAGLKVSQIGVQLGRPTCTISREIKRNGGYLYSSADHRHPDALRVDPHRPRQRVYRHTYSARSAQTKARRRVRLIPRGRTFADPVLCTLVARLLAYAWSPQQVAGWLRTHYPDRADWQVSHETIYQALFCQARGELRKDLERQLRLLSTAPDATAQETAGGLAPEQVAAVHAAWERAGLDRHTRTGARRILDPATAGDHRQVLRSGRATRRRRPDRIAGVASSRGKPWTAGWNISDRPAEAEDRAVPGHWEGDLLIGKNGKSAIITLVERSTRYVLLGALPDGRDSPAVITVLTDLIGRLPEHLRSTLTWDNGVELARACDFRIATGCPVYFADPHHPWQRGTNENTNGLLRQYFPKGVTDFRTIDQALLDDVALSLNRRPRMTLGYDTPANQLAAVLTPPTT